MTTSRPVRRTDAAPARPANAARLPIRFPGHDAAIAGWLYPGVNGACVVMAGGLAVPKEPATDQFAARFHAAGYTVLAFDYRRLGESGGAPRLALSVKGMIADWQTTIGHARDLPGVDPDRVAAWAFSASAGVLLNVAARGGGLAAVIAQTPTADGLAALRNARRYQTPAAMARLTGRALLDAGGAMLHRPPRLVPLLGAPGTVAMLTTPDAVEDGPRALRAAAYPAWSQQVAARSAVRIGFHRPGRDAPRITCPVLVVACDDDRTSLAAPAVRAARRAPHGELNRLPGGHYAPFLQEHERAVAVQLAFLQRHVGPADGPQS